MRRRGEPSSPDELRRLAAWFRLLSERAKRASNSSIRAARLRTAEELEAEADSLETAQVPTLWSDTRDRRQRRPGNPPPLKNMLRRVLARLTTLPVNARRSSRSGTARTTAAGSAAAGAAPPGRTPPRG